MLPSVPYNFPVFTVAEDAVSDPKKLFRALNSLVLEINKMLQTQAATINYLMAAIERLGAGFFVEIDAPVSLHLIVNAGHLYVLSTTTLTEVAQQKVGPFTVPTSHPRIDRIVGNATSGAASIVVGTESATPTPPAITSGSFPIAQIYLVPGITVVQPNALKDERALAVGGN